DEQLVLDKAKYRFAISPDGLEVAFPEKRGEERILTIVSLVDGQVVKTFPLVDRKASLSEIAWPTDSKNLAYILVSGEIQNNGLWLQPLDGGTPRQIADLGNEIIEDFAVAPDGKSFEI